MAEIVEWPIDALVPKEIGLNLAWNSRDGGAGLNGVTQIVSPLSALWEVSLALGLAGNVRVRAMRAVMAEIKGRYGWVRFPIFDPFRVRFADAGWDEPVLPGIPFSDGSLFSDGTGFRYPDIATTVEAVGELGAEEITLDVGSIDDALGTGQFFSINDYLYMVVRPLTISGSNRVFKIAPPLREDVAVNDEVKIGRPTILCRLVDDRSGFANLSYGRFGEARLDLVEVLERE